MNNPFNINDVLVKQRKDGRFRKGKSRKMIVVLAVHGYYVWHTLQNDRTPSKTVSKYSHLVEDGWIKIGELKYLFFDEMKGGEG